MTTLDWWRNRSSCCTHTVWAALQYSLNISGCHWISAFVDTCPSHKVIHEQNWIPSWTQISVNKIPHIAPGLLEIILLWAGLCRQDDNKDIVSTHQVFSLNTLRTCALWPAILDPLRATDTHSLCPRKHPISGYMYSCCANKALVSCLTCYTYMYVTCGGIKIGGGGAVFAENALI